MALIAAFRWDSTSREVSYLIIDDTNFQVRGATPVRHAAATQAAAKAAIDAFFQLLAGLPAGTIEYKIVAHAAPVAHFSGNRQHHQPNPLTAFVSQEFQNGCAGLTGWTVSSQVQSLLNNGALSKFKSGLKDLQLWNSQMGAYAAHLWSIALHTTQGTHKNDLKKLWKTIRQIATSTAAGRQQFAAWFQQL